MSKLSYEDKINIYLKKKKGQSRKSLSKEYKVNELIIAYLYYLIDKHGYDILRKNKNKYYEPYVKEQIINRVLINGESVFSLAIDGYIQYYNYDRIKEKLKGLSPVSYRLQSSN